MRKLCWLEVGRSEEPSAVASATYGPARRGGVAECYQWILLPIAFFSIQ